MSEEDRDLRGLACDEAFVGLLGDEVDETWPEVSPLSLAVAVTSLQLVSRSAWGARPPKAQPAFLASTLGTKVHYTGGTVDTRLLDDHRRCAPAVRAIQNGHMDGNGWNDIGYTAVACPHRYVFIGRGPHRLPAANGPGLNSGHYGVCALVGNRGVTEPVDGQLHALRDAIEWLRTVGRAGTEIKGHRDGYATDCPGDPLYAWVRMGAPRPKEEDDVTPEDIEAIARRTAVLVSEQEINSREHTVGLALQSAKDNTDAMLPLVRHLAAAGGVDVDEAALAAALAPALLATLTPQAIADAVSVEVARDLADELARRLEA